MFGVLLMQRECTSMLSGVAVSVGRGVVVMPKAGAEVYCKEYASFFLLNSRLCFVMHLLLWLENPRLGFLLRA